MNVGIPVYSTEKGIKADQRLASMDVVFTMLSRTLYFVLVFTPVKAKLFMLISYQPIKLLRYRDSQISYANPTYGTFQMIVGPSPSTIRISIFQYCSQA